MSFPCLTRTSRLSEKPWKVEAVARLIASVVVCVMIGAVVTADITYFAGPEHKSTALFLGASVAALVCFGEALYVLARPWPLEKSLRKLLILLICIYGGFLLMWAIARLTGDPSESQNTTVRVLIAVLAFQGAALVLVHFFLREHHTGWVEGFGFDQSPGHALVTGFLVALLVALPVTMGLNLAINILVEWLTAHRPPEQEAVQIISKTVGWANRLVLAVATIVIAPVAEEVIFRGILYPAIKRAGYPRLALWGTAVLFGLIHLNLGTFVPLTFLAIVLACLYEYTGNLLACITVHGLFNATNFVALYLLQK
jgi:uncharacterized protein